MVLETLVTKQELSSYVGNPAKKDALLRRQLHIRQDDLERIREGYRNPEERVIRAAEWLRDHNLELQINYTVLTAMCYREWDKPSHQGVKISAAVRRRYPPEYFRWKEIPAIQQLREELDAYEGNLHAAKESWRYFMPSNEDWDRQVTIPTSIDEQVALLLGIIWGDGHISGSGLVMNGRKNHHEFYNNTIKPELEELFNITAHVRSNRFKERAEIGEKVIYPDPRMRTPTIYVSSHAVATWLEHDLGLPRNRKIHWVSPYDFSSWRDDEQYHFFMGMVAALGNFYERERDMFIFRIRRKNDAIRALLLDLAEQFGYNPTQYGNIVEFGNNDVFRLMNTGLLVNDNHLKTLGISP